MDKIEKFAERFNLQYEDVEAFAVVVRLLGRESMRNECVDYLKSYQELAIQFGKTDYADEARVIIMALEKLKL